MLAGIRADALLEVAFERMAQRTGGFLMQGGEAVDGLFGGMGNDEII